MKIKSLIRKVLREEYTPTETNYLGWEVPKGLYGERLYDELKSIGIKLWDDYNDIIYVAEIHFDNKDVVFEILTSDGEIYDNTPNVPGTFKSYYTFKIEDLPRNVKSFIVRRLEKSWFNYMGI